MTAYDRGTMGALPWAATGSGAPVVVLGGVNPATGVHSNTLVRAVLAPVRHLSGTRRLYALNRRRDLPAGMTMEQLASEHAQAFAEFFGEPIDLVGVSTGGSIAQQVAADHPDTVRRLVLISTGCRLGPRARAEQAELAELLRADRVRDAGALLAMDVVGWAGPLGRAAGRAVARPMLGGRRMRADLATTLEAEDSFDLAACAAQVRAETLIVGGTKDQFYDRALFEETAALIPGSTLYLAPRRGHLTVANDKRARAQIAGFLGRGVP